MNKVLALRKCYHPLLSHDKGGFLLPIVNKMNMRKRKRGINRINNAGHFDIKAWLEVGKQEKEGERERYVPHLGGKRAACLFQPLRFSFFLPSCHKRLWIHQVLDVYTYLIFYNWFLVDINGTVLFQQMDNGSSKFSLTDFDNKHNLSACKMLTDMF